MGASPSTYPTTLSAEAILSLWESASAQHPLDQALSILAAVEPGTTRPRLALLPSGRRDARLLTAYRCTFGRDLFGIAACPRCQERVEYSLDVDDMLATAERAATESPLDFDADGYAFTYRLPNSLDLAAIAGLEDVDRARSSLLERCLLQATHDGAEIRCADVPEAVVAALVEQMAADDPFADLELALTCPACASRWELIIDVATFFWAMIEAQARRLVHEVHTLARAYGWAEADVLALSPARRQAYLELVS